MSQQNLDLVRGAYEAYNRRDAEGVLDALHPEIDWHAPESLAWGARAQGVEAVTAFLQGLRPYLGDEHRVWVDDLIDGGERVVALARHRGVAPDGRPYDVPTIMVWTVRDGRAVACYEQLDTLSMARATEGVVAGARV